MIFCSLKIRQEDDIFKAFNWEYVAIKKQNKSWRRFLSSKPYLSYKV